MRKKWGRRRRCGSIKWSRSTSLCRSRYIDSSVMTWALLMRGQSPGPLFHLTSARDTCNPSHFRPFPRHNAAPALAGTLPPPIITSITHKEWRLPSWEKNRVMWSYLRAIDAEVTGWVHLASSSYTNVEKLQTTTIQSVHSLNYMILYSLQTTLFICLHSSFRNCNKLKMQINLANTATGCRLRLDWWVLE